MKKNVWTVKEIIKILEIDEQFVFELEKEEIICPYCDAEENQNSFPDSEVEKIRIAKILIEEMDVNLPGVEVILRMRQNMVRMKEQFDTVLEELIKELQNNLLKK